MGNTASADRPFHFFAGSIPAKNIIVFFLNVLQVRMFSLLRSKLSCLRFFSTEESGSAMLPNALDCNQLDISGLSTARRYFQELESR